MTFGLGVVQMLIGYKLTVLFSVCVFTCALLTTFPIKKEQKELTCLRRRVVWAVRSDRVAVVVCFVPALEQVFRCKLKRQRLDVLISQ